MPFLSQFRRSVKAFWQSRLVQIPIYYFIAQTVYDARYMVSVVPELRKEFNLEGETRSRARELARIEKERFSSGKGSPIKTIRDHVPNGRFAERFERAEMEVRRHEEYIQPMGSWALIFLQAALIRVYWVKGLPGLNYFGVSITSIMAVYIEEGLSSMVKASCLWNFYVLSKLENEKQNSGTAEEVWGVDNGTVD